MNADWLKDLNPAQRDAVTHGDGPLLVVAGAGTGKTRTLASRVAWLIGQGVSPDRILLLTFTRRAAAEMLRRAGHLTSADVAGSVWGGTFHAVGNRLLRYYGQGIGLDAGFTVMDQGDSADLMNLIRGELGLGSKKRRFPRKETLLAIYSRTVNAREKLADTLGVHFPWCRAEQGDVQAVFQRYVERKREQNVLDFDDLLLYWHILCTEPGIGDAVGGRFDHVLVDEYQDTNAIQAETLLGMRRGINNIMVVGDDAQSIYSFRAATVRNILDFPNHFPGTRTVTLEQNYRSTQPILNASNAVIEQAGERFTKNLWSTRSSEQKPVLCNCIDEPHQCVAVCERVLTHLEDGTALMKQAVLFRAGHHSAQLEIELTRRNIPFHKYGGLKFVEAAHIKDLLALLRVLENPYDQISWFRVLQMLEGVGPKRAGMIMDSLGVRKAPGGQRSEPTAGGSSRSRSEDPSDRRSPLVRLLNQPPVVPPVAKQQFELLRATLAECAGLKPGSEADSVADRPALMIQIERIRNFYQPLFELRFENARIRVRDLEQLERIASTYRSRSSFITDLTLDPPTSTSDFAQAPHLDEDYLILSTIHSAKGCEWDVVHVIHAADGMIPSDMALGSPEGVDEERRLFYVAMTRAKNALYIYFPFRYYHRKHSLGDRHTYAQLTRFISDQTRGLLEERNAESAERPWPEQAPVDGRRRLDDRLQDLWRP